MKIKIFLALLFSQVLSYGQIIPIPDINFKYKLTHADATNSTAAGYVIDTNHNGEIEVSEAILINYLNLFSSNISDLTGIEYFSNLDHLYFQYNSVSNINVTSLSNLVVLRCDHNNLNSIDLTGLNSLVGLNVGYNHIYEMDFSFVANLSSLVCDNNLISTLDFSNNHSFKWLKCSYNNLISLSIKNGINQDFSTGGYGSNDCWKTGNPNLTTVCADASEVAAVQSFLNGCGDATQIVNVVSDCSMSTEEFGTNQIAITPNPSDGVFTISFEDIIQKAKVEIYTLVGQKIYDGEIYDAKESSIDLSSLSSGTYLLKISNSTNSINKIIIKN